MRGRVRIDWLLVRHRRGGGGNPEPRARATKGPGVEPRYGSLFGSGVEATDGSREQQAATRDEAERLCCGRLRQVAAAGNSPPASYKQEVARSSRAPPTRRIPSRDGCNRAVE